MCDAGWTDVGDFNPQRGLDCSIFIESVLGLAAVSLIVGGISQLVFMSFLWTTATGPAPAKREGPSLKLRFAVVYTIQTATCNVYDIAQIIDHKAAIYGGSIYITILMAVAYVTAYGGCVVFFEAVMKLLRGVCGSLTGDAQERVAATTSLFFSRARYLYGICALTGLVTLVSLVVPPGKVHIVCRATFALWCLFHVLFMASFNPPINLIRAELAPFIALLERSVSAEASTKSSAQQLKQVRFHLLAAQICVNLVMILTTVIYVLWASWDLLIRKTVYVIMYCTLGVHIMSFPMLVALSYKGPTTRDPSNRTLRNNPVDKPQFREGGQPSHYAQHSHNSSFYEKVLPGADSEAHHDLEHQHEHRQEKIEYPATWTEEEVAEGKTITSGEVGVV